MLACCDGNINLNETIPLFDTDGFYVKILDLRTLINGYEKSMKNIVNFKVEKIIFNDPATIVFWTDGTKTVVKCSEEDTYDKEKGIALCYMKKMLGNSNKFNDVINGLIDPDYRKKRRKKKKLQKAQGGNKK